VGSNPTARTIFILLTKVYKKMSQESEQISSDTSKLMCPTESGHCGDCPFLKPYGDEYDLTACCSAFEAELDWYDYWLALCGENGTPELIAEKQKKI